MWPDRVSNPGPLTYESGALLTALHGLALRIGNLSCHNECICERSRSWFDYLNPGFS